MCCSFNNGYKGYNFCYKLNNIAIQRVCFFKDLGVTVDQALSFENHINMICATASQRAALILKCFTSREPILLVKAFITYVRPLLEYASCIWSPFKLKLIDKIESVQRHFTKKLYGLYNFSYENRLKHLGIESLELRRLKNDLIMYFKILHNLVNIDPKIFFSLCGNNITRGHPFKLVKPYCSNNSQLNNFNCRAINAWNHLDSEIVMCKSVFAFKAKLNLLNVSYFCKR